MTRACRSARPAIDPARSGTLSIAAGGTLAVSTRWTQTSTGTLTPQAAMVFTPPNGSTYAVLDSGGLGGATFTAMHIGLGYDIVANP